MDLNRKIEKYSYKLATSTDFNKRNFYEIKLRQYKAMVKKGGSTKIESVINPQKQAAIAALDQLKSLPVNIIKLNKELEGKITELQRSAEKAVTNYNTLADEYGKLAIDLVSFAKQITIKANELKTGTESGANVDEIKKMLEEVKNKIDEILNRPSDQVLADAKKNASESLGNVIVKAPSNISELPKTQITPYDKVKQNILTSYMIRQKGVAKIKSKELQRLVNEKNLDLNKYFLEKGNTNYIVNELFNEITKLGNSGVNDENDEAFNEIKLILKLIKTADGHCKIFNELKKELNIYHEMNKSFNVARYFPLLGTDANVC